MGSPLFDDRGISKKTGEKRQIMEVNKMDKNAKHYPLNVTMPQHCAYVVRDLPQATVEQRERALNATHWNEFAFPSGMLTVDMLSDSGTTAMTNQQWATLFLGDEAYGRNTGYYVLLDTFRDIFERGGEKNWKKVIDLVRTDCRDIEKMMDEVYLCEYEGGLFNGGAAQMERPNAFIIQQGRAAESVLMEIVKKILAQRHPGKVFTIPSNGHFDTTEGNIKQMGSIPRNLYHKELLYQVPEGGKYEKNPFKGNMDIEKLEQLIAGNYRTEARMTICGELYRDGARICQTVGLNDVTINRDPVENTLELDVYLEEQLVDSYQADGIIIATPTGSTGYSLSAGGPLIYPGTECLIVNPICAHVLGTNAIIVPAAGGIEIHLTRSSKDAYLLTDGRYATHLRQGDTVRVYKAETPTRIVQLEKHQFFETVRNKLLDRNYRRMHHRGGSE